MYFMPPNFKNDNSNNKGIAKVFFETSQIRNLKKEQQQLLIQAINKGNKNYIVDILRDFQEKKMIKLKQLVEDVKRRMNLTVTNIQTIVILIIEDKKVQQSILNIFNQNIRHLENLKNNLMIIESLKGPQKITGKITEIGYVQNSFIQIELQGEKRAVHEIKLNYKNNFIQKATIQSRKFINFKQWLNKIEPKKFSLQQFFKSIPVDINHMCVCQFSSVLQNSIYDIQVKFDQNMMLKSIIFTNMNGKFVSFYVTKNQSNMFEVQNQNWPRAVNFQQFIKFYQLVVNQTSQIIYNNQKQINSSIKIKKYSLKHQTLFEMDEKINATKSRLIACFLSQKYNKLLSTLLNKLILYNTFKGQKDFVQNEINKNEVKQIKIMLEKLVQYKKQRGQILTMQLCLQEVLKQTNYSLLVRKTGTIDTVRILSLLTQSQAQTKRLKNKYILDVFGDTGAGKSTFVNFLLGIPLKTIVNEFGNRVVVIDQQELKQLKQNNEQIARIGHSMNVSETIYSKGHNFISNTLNQKLKVLCKNVIICDNPGFKDTRGTVYQVVTSISIDRAIQISQAVRAILLVIPFGLFELNRNNGVIQLISQMKKRFPDIIKRGTKTYQAFYILITKSSQQIIQQKFRDRLCQYIQQEQRNIDNNNPNDIDMDNQKRLYVWTALLDLFDNNRIHFIDVTNLALRQRLIEIFLQNNKVSVPKQKYRKFMESGGHDSFIQHLSKSAHTWTVMLLHPFFEIIPNKLKEHKQTINNMQKNIQNFDQQITSFKQNKQSSLKMIEKVQQNLRILQRQKYDIEGSRAQLQLNMEDDVLKSSKQALQSQKKIYQDLQKKFNSIKQKNVSQRNRLNESASKISQTQQKISILKNIINSSSKGKQKRQIYTMQFRIGQEKQLFSWTDQQWDQAFYSVKGLSNGRPNTTFVIGKEQKSLTRQPYIQRQFALVPLKNFDPNSYIQAFNNSQQYESNSHKAFIDSKGVTLQRINFSPDKKKIVMTLSYTLKKCDNHNYDDGDDVADDNKSIKSFKTVKIQSIKVDQCRNKRCKQLPYLIIYHEIDNSIINATLILNKQSQLDKQLKQMQQMKQKQQQQQKQYTTSIQNQQIIHKNVIETKQNIASLQESTGKKIEQHLQNIIQTQKHNIERYQNDIISIQQMKQKTKENILEIQNTLQTYKFTYRRIAYLIKQQYQKNIPQALMQFIEMAKNIYKEDKKVLDDDEEKSKAKQHNIQNFKNFIALFHQNKNKLHKQIQNALTNKQFQPKEEEVPIVLMNTKQKDEVYLENIKLQIVDNPNNNPGTSITRNNTSQNENDCCFCKQRCLNYFSACSVCCSTCYSACSVCCQACCSQCSLM